MKSLNLASCIVLLTSYIFPSCTTIDLYEKSVTIPQHAWENSFRPSFDFTIKDTTAPYKLFLILRHNEKYNFNNIYVNVYVRGPGQDSIQKNPAGSCAGHQRKKAGLPPEWMIYMITAFL